MKRAYAVIGANFGDEGKGALTDYLCSIVKPDLVIRFNGGAQAGHTVTTPAGERHVFHHFGSGTFLQVPTYLSRHFLVNPIMFLSEHEELAAYKPIVYAHPNAFVSTPYDMMLNFLLEQHRGENKHGSCLLGINETVERSQNLYFGLTVHDLTDDNMASDLEIIRTEYVPHRLESLGVPMTDQAKAWLADDGIVEKFVEDCRRFLNHVILARPIANRVVFEGAQGLALDQHSHAYFPHLTRSNTGIDNVLDVMPEFGLEADRAGLDVTYVTRTYLTRHGAGPLPGEFENGRKVFGDLYETNSDASYQGVLRYAPMHLEQVKRRIDDDRTKHSGHVSLHVSHADVQNEFTKTPQEIAAFMGIESLTYSTGPTRNHVKTLNRSVR